MQNEIRKFKSSYSKELGEILEIMLTWDKLERPDFCRLREIIFNEYKIKCAKIENLHNTSLNKSTDLIND